MTTRIAQDLIAHQVVSAERSRALATRLEYRTAEPYEVRLVFHADRRSPVTWIFARDLLVDGLSRPSGTGDVRIRPTLDGGRHLLSVLLVGEDDHALIELPSDEVGAFVLRTLRLVPKGEEVQRLDFDALAMHLPA
ncbi:SsgA family sporulation/cell division regulator [Streptacidiphilus pinicola]|uniref:SsgA family sporulation/cell division regulator n=1 Tax=Streptacidiphilus pinicola TaxID=2219663 RepID=A0A2X0INX3_9ACTN|nr:SsgA family sporulation/cell division regulator [Streptacidiphilus pinicola]RAG85223.1 SsgA family sporulation/cell division regulator [Streptacidiphilus pinicola]